MKLSESASLHNRALERSNTTGAERSVGGSGKDADFYLKSGPPPSPSMVARLKAAPEAERIAAWRECGSLLPFPCYCASL